LAVKREVNTARAKKPKQKKRNLRWTVF